MIKKTIIIADDDSSIRKILSEALSRSGYEVQLCSNASSLWDCICNGVGDLVISDVLMPDENGLELLPKIKNKRPDLPIIIMSAKTNMMTAIKSTEHGAFDYLPKPFDLNVMKSSVSRALKETGIENLLSPFSNDDEKMPIIGKSLSMQDIFKTLAKVISTDLTVLISGESGTGKELVAKALHDFGNRRHKPFVPINMAAIPNDLIESYLFGHEQGAFTGAIKKSLGRFEIADGGTLFLDEIGDMPLDIQTRLLRVLEEGEYNTVGGTITKKTNVRIIAATNHSLEKEVNSGKFREDLYYRLNVVPLYIPPLRERKSDIAELVNYFFTTSIKEGFPEKQIDSDALEILKNYDWPGNVRELKNIVRRMMILIPDQVINASAIKAIIKGDIINNEFLIKNSIGESVRKHLEKHFDAHMPDLPPPGLYERIIREIERPLIELCLSATNGNQIKAALLLGLNRNTLRKRIKELKISPVKGR
ncbi:nitrogen regulation protein NR(I) [Alphaproteobacteria bacterium]|nr:nitrogen regulation protein NR(I) [Alphaproteobacteria bacterium]